MDWLHDFTAASESKAFDRNDAPPSLALGKTYITRSHEVAFYSDDAAFVVGFTRFIGKRRRKYTVDDRHSLFLNLWTSPTNLVTSFFIYNSCGLGCCWQSVI